MAKKKVKAKVLVDCNLCKYACELGSGEVICTTKYRGEEIPDYSLISTKPFECGLYRGKRDD